MRVCEVKWCEKPHEGHGFCNTHLARFKRGGDPHIPSIYEMTPLQRFFRDTDKHGGEPVDKYMWNESMGECWLWTGSTRGEYGVVHVNGGRVTAHVFSYRTLVGDYPDDYDVDHLCRNKLCVNPEHLEPVTEAENIRRMQEALGIGPYKEVCDRGHRFDDVGYYSVSPNHKGRQCKECTRIRSRKYEASHPKRKDRPNN